MDAYATATAAALMAPDKSLGEPISSERGALAAMAQLMDGSARERTELLARIDDVRNASDPGQLLKLQVELAGHLHEVAVTAALASHAVKGLETLLKS